VSIFWGLIDAIARATAEQDAGEHELPDDPLTIVG
jgi:hypothetical protein